MGINEGYIEIKIKKSQKILSVIKEFYKNKILSSLNCLDLGCSNGVIAGCMGDYFAKVTGIDPSSVAIDHAVKNEGKENVEFFVMDGSATKFEDKTFDVIICNHIYEHVKDKEAQKILFREIDRILKDDGCCYLAAMNKFTPIEPHYHLPFLSWLPKKYANLYARLSNKKSRSYAGYHPLSFRDLTKLVDEHFKINDFTCAVIEDPTKFAADDVLAQGSFYQRVAIFVCKRFYFLVPTYIWILTKKDPA